MVPVEDCDRRALAEAFADERSHVCDERVVAVDYDRFMM